MNDLVLPDGFPLIFTRRELSGHANLYSLVCQGEPLALAKRPLVSIPTFIDHDRDRVESHLLELIQHCPDTFLYIRNGVWGWRSSSVDFIADPAPSRLKVAFAKLLCQCFLFIK